MLVELAGIDEADLRRQREFLVSRADHRMGDGEHAVRELTIAATLLRDAASLSLLLEEIETARRQLVLSGQIFLRAGHAVGATLLTLADPGAVGVADFYARTSYVAGEAADRTSAASASSEFQTMVARQQVDWLVGFGPFRLAAKAVDDREAGRARMDGRLLGNTGLTFGSYRAAMEAMEPSDGAIFGTPLPELDMPAEVGMALHGLGVNRAEDLRLAMADRHHWRMMLRPSALIDYDAVVLMCRALMSGLAPDGMRVAMQMVWPAVDAPLCAAELLRPVKRDRGGSDSRPAPLTR